MFVENVSAAMARVGRNRSHGPSVESRVSHMELKMLLSNLSQGSYIGNDFSQSSRRDGYITRSSVADLSHQQIQYNDWREEVI